MESFLMSHDVYSSCPAGRWEFQVRILVLGLFLFYFFGFEFVAALYG